MDLSIVMVGYNAGRHIPVCLDSIFGSPQAVDFEVVMVDNASKDDGVEMVEERYPAVNILRNETNRGFARACNQGIAAASGRYILLLNTDTSTVGDALTRLVRFMDAMPNAGAAGPRLINADGALQHSIRNFPTMANQLAQALFLNRVFPRAGSLQETVVDPGAYAAVRPVEWVSGAALIVRREALEAVGPLDERYFVYAEEKDWCRRAAAAGYPTYFCPEAKIVHFGGAYAVDPALYRELVKSRLGYLRRHKTATFQVFRAITALDLSVRVGLWSAATALSRREDSRRRLRAYVEGLSYVIGRDRSERSRMR